MRSFWMVMALLCVSSLAQAQEDAVPEEGELNADLLEDGSWVDMSRWSMDGGYPAEVGEKALFGFMDIVTTPVELVATPFRRAFYADATRRPVFMFFVLGLPEGAMNAYFRLTEGAGNLLTFPIATQRNRFANYSIWYWDRYQVES